MTNIPTTSNYRCCGIVGLSSEIADILLACVCVCVFRTLLLFEHSDHVVLAVVCALFTHSSSPARVFLACLWFIHSFVRPICNCVVGTKFVTPLTVVGDYGYEL